MGSLVPGSAIVVALIFSICRRCFQNFVGFAAILKNCITALKTHQDENHIILSIRHLLQLFRCDDPMSYFKTRFVFYHTDFTFDATMSSIDIQ